MHSTKELTSSAFMLLLDGRQVSIPDLFPGFDEYDRLGVVVHQPGGALGASVLILATITAFYDIQRSVPTTSSSIPTISSSTSASSSATTRCSTSGPSTRKSSWRTTPRSAARDQRPRHHPAAGAGRRARAARFGRRRWRAAVCARRWPTRRAAGCATPTLSPPGMRSPKRTSGRCSTSRRQIERDAREAIGSDAQPVTASATVRSRATAGSAWTPPAPVPAPSADRLLLWVGLTQLPVAGAG